VKKKVQRQSLKSNTAKECEKEEGKQLLGLSQGIAENIINKS